MAPGQAGGLFVILPGIGHLLASRGQSPFCPLVSLNKADLVSPRSLGQLPEKRNEETGDGCHERWEETTQGFGMATCGGEKPEEGLGGCVGWDSGPHWLVAFFGTSIW